MIALVMIMLHILMKRMPKRGFPKQDQPRQGFVLHRSHPALRVGVQIRRPWWQRYPCDPGRVEELLKGRTIFSISVMDQVLPGRQEAPLLHRNVTGDLHHPGLIGMWRHPRNMDLSAAQMDEE